MGQSASRVSRDAAEPRSRRVQTEQSEQVLLLVENHDSTMGKPSGELEGSRGRLVRPQGGRRGVGNAHRRLVVRHTGRQLRDGAGKDSRVGEQHHLDARPLQELPHLPHGCVGGEGLRITEHDVCDDGSLGDFRSGSAHDSYLNGSPARKRNGIAYAAPSASPLLNR